MIHIPNIKNDIVRPIPLGHKAVGENSYGIIMEKSILDYCHIPNDCDYCKYDVNNKCRIDDAVNGRCQIIIGDGRYYKR